MTTQYIFDKSLHRKTRSSQNTYSSIQGILMILNYVRSFAGQMHIEGKYWAQNTNLEGAPFLQARLIKIFFLIVLAHFALQVSFNSPDYGIREILGFEVQHSPAKAFYHTHHNTSQPSTKLPIAEFLRGTELQEKPPLYKVYNFYASLTLIKSATLDASENFHLEFLRSLQNRPQLSLFVLHHSWKSYLS